MKKLLKILPLCGLFLLSPGARAQNTYTNPVMDFDMPDPTVICADDGSFYLYATEGHGYSIPIVRSFDLVNWERVGAGLQQGDPSHVRTQGRALGSRHQPAEEELPALLLDVLLGRKQNVRHRRGDGGQPAGTLSRTTAPCSAATRSACSTPSTRNSCAKGAATTFSGAVSGAFMPVELTKDGLAVKAGSEPKQIAGGAFEATYIHKRDGYYYLFASIGSCCEGLNSTYTTVVGRSRSLMGPYTDKSGKGMLDNGYEVVIRRSDRVRRPRAQLRHHHRQGGRRLVALSRRGFPRPAGPQTAARQDRVGRRMADGPQWTPFGYSATDSPFLNHKT